jgi:hypothetical protein
MDDRPLPPQSPDSPGDAQPPQTPAAVPFRPEPVGQPEESDADGGDEGPLPGADDRRPRDPDNPDDDGYRTPPDGEIPTPPDAIVQAARVAPDHWFYFQDRAWTGADMPPSWAMVGRWRSDAAGDIVEWQDNTRYRPSPEALGWPEPADPVDAAVQLAVTGYGSDEDACRALADAEVAVLTAPDGEPLTAVLSDGTPGVPVFTAPIHLRRAGGFSFERYLVRDLVRQLPLGHFLYVNPPSPADMSVDVSVLTEVLDGNGESRESDGSGPGEAPSADAGAPPAPRPDDGAPADSA